MEVLQNKTQITKARQQLVMLGASSLESAWRKQLRRFGLVKEPAVGDEIKSWDVLETLKFLKANLGKDDAILDIGAFASEIIVALHSQGFTNLTGADLNPDLHKMPHLDKICYEITNFMQTPFENASFQAITSISVIEHGFNGEALLREMSRLLRPGGYFIASFDYWPEKIDTTGVKFFGMDWLIFSREDIGQLIELAAGYGLYPVGKMNYSADEHAVDCAGKEYTFGWIVFEKSI